MKFVRTGFLLSIIVIAGIVMGTIKEKSLKTYRSKRDFAITPEPKGAKKKSSKNPIFVIHKHDASHLHYDLRLEISGVLKSWAVPKGITTDPAEKHLAIETEDHPMEYAKFEGVIPEGQYGAGTVMIWDKGTYTNIKKKNGKTVPMSECYKQGRIEIQFEGKKLHGAYALIKTKLRAGKESWLLIKMDDKYAHKRIIKQDKSAVTDRTMKQIAQQEA